MIRVTAVDRLQFRLAGGRGWVGVCVVWQLVGDGRRSIGVGSRRYSSKADKPGRFGVVRAVVQAIIRRSASQEKSGCGLRLDGGRAAR